MTSKEKNNKDNDKLTDIPEEAKKKNGAEINVNQKTKFIFILLLKIRVFP